MTNNNLNPEIIQKEYYKKTAKNYDHMHGVDSDDDEHTFALFQLIGLLEYLNINSILDVGSGTGRAIKFINDKNKNIKIVGIEPVKELREIGYRNGISNDKLID